MKKLFFYLPWHIQFLDRWLYAKRKKKVLVYSYDDLIESPEKILTNSLNHLDIKSKEKKFKQYPSKIVIGKKNRGKKLIDKKIQNRVYKLIKLHSFNFKEVEDLIFD